MSDPMDNVALLLSRAQAEQAMEALAWGWKQARGNDPDEERSEEMAARLRELHDALHYARYTKAPR